MTLEDLILFVDGEAIVIDKPAGLPVDQPRAGGTSIEARIGELTLGFARPPVAMHRLDRDTSGCLLFARNHKSRATYQQAFEGGTVRKAYVAVVDGVLDADEGIIDLPVAKTSSAESGWRMVVDDAGKPAVTHWRRIAEVEGETMVEFRPQTGRTHQIRVHAASGLGVPIVGDPVYGPVRGGSGEPMLLHSRFLSIPRGEKPPAQATAPLPATFANAGFGQELLDEAEL